MAEKAKPYEIEFSYTNTGSTIVAARTPEDAVEAASSLLEHLPGVKVVSAKEITQEGRVIN